MIRLSTDRQVYQFCSTCRLRLVVSHTDGDVISMRCPAGHESLLSYRSIEGLKRYAMELFRPHVGIGFKEE